MSCLMASMAVGSSPARGVLRSHRYSYQMIVGVIISAANPDGPAPGVMRSPEVQSLEREAKIAPNEGF